MTFTLTKYLEKTLVSVSKGMHNSFLTFRMTFTPTKYLEKTLVSVSKRCTTLYLSLE